MLSARFPRTPHGPLGLGALLMLALTGALEGQTAQPFSRPAEDPPPVATF